MQVGFRIDDKPETLLALDRRGLLASAGESVEEYLARIRKLQRNIGAMEEALSKDGHYEIEGIDVVSKDRIRPSFFDSANAQCLELFGFEADWVPAFFINPSFSLLFGGCSFSFLPDFFAMFIIRRSFKNSQRWLLYGRDELIAHEMCHVARAPLMSNAYEETFAYCTSQSSFRKYIGGIFLSQWDSFLLLGSTFVLLLAQICNIFLIQLPMWIFWLLPPIVLAWLMLRYWKLRRRMARAHSTLEAKYGQNATKVLFRCSDDEIDALANGTIPDNLAAPKTARAIILRQWEVR
ncbi:MAG: hypothetical protein IKS20_03185 [Victivallales bacterium]|nr:hypothetical protein [Victivallales bacterium]